MLQRLVTSVTEALTCVNADTLMAHQSIEAVGPEGHQGIDDELWWAWAVTLMTRGT